MAVVTVYSKPNCQQCDATYRALDRKKIPYEVGELTDELTAEFKARGLMAAPIVTSPLGEWAGFRPDRIRDLALHLEGVNA